MTETCGEELNLIVDVQIEPATTADNTYLKSAVENSEAVLGSTAAEISADGAYYSEHNEAYAKEQDKEIHYTGFPGKAGRYDYERSEEGVVVIDRVSGERQIAEEYKPGRYRFRAEGKWRYITDKDIDAALCSCCTRFSDQLVGRSRCAEKGPDIRSNLKCNLTPSRTRGHSPKNHEVTRLCQHLPTAISSVSMNPTGRIGSRIDSAVE